MEGKIVFSLGKKPSPYPGTDEYRKETLIRQEIIF
jgi:hypothetical protein